MIHLTSVAHHCLVTSIDPRNLERLFLLQRRSVAPKKWLLDKWLELSQCFQPWNIKLSAGYASFCFTLKSSSLFLSSPATSHRSRTNNSLRTFHFLFLYLKQPISIPRSSIPNTYSGSKTCNILSVNSNNDVNKMEVSLKLREDDKDINHMNMTQDFSFISQVFWPEFESLHNNFLIPANVPFTTNAISGHQLF
mgnify:CR=1 FL=1